MRGTLLPSVKVARTKSYWPSTPKMPVATGEQVPLPRHLAAAEDSVALGIDGLDELGAGAAGREILAAQNAGRLPEDEVVVLGVVGLGVEAERTVVRLRPSSAVLAVSIFRPGLPISNVPGAS